MAERIQLVKSVIAWHIYSWLVSLIKEVDNWIRNFIDKRKFSSIAWHKVCVPTAEIL